MKHAPWATAALSCAFALTTTAAFAADYYVATTGNDSNDGSAATPFATIDAAITNAVAGDIIYVAAGTYSTTTQWGPNLKAKLIGEGTSRDDVVIQSAGTYRTLRMAAGSLKMRNQRTCSSCSASKSRRQDSQRDRCRSNLRLTARGKSLSIASSASSMASLQFMSVSVLCKMRFLRERIVLVSYEVSALRNVNETLLC